MKIDHASEESPCATPSVHADYAQDLEEAKTSERGGGEHLVVLSPSHDDHQWRHTDEDVCTDKDNRQKVWISMS